MYTVVDRSNLELDYVVQGLWSSGLTVWIKEIEERRRHSIVRVAVLPECCRKKKLSFKRYNCFTIFQMLIRFHAVVVKD